MRKNQKDTGYHNTKNSPRMSSGRGRDFDTDSDLYSEDYYQSESRRGQRSDYEYEQADRPRFASGQQYRNQNDFSGNFPSSELSRSERRESGFNRPQSYEQNYGQNLQGLHAGKGPKGYQRSDERIREDICDALAANAHVDASEVEVEVSEGMVTLTGSVDSRQAKRIAEQAVEGVHGIKDIHNQLQIEALSGSQRQTNRFAPSKSAKAGKKSSSNYKQ